MFVLHYFVETVNQSFEITDQAGIQINVMKG